MPSKLKLALVRNGAAAWRIAILAGLSPTQLTRITTGHRQARPEERAALAKVLGCGEAELFGDCAPAVEARAA